MKKKISIMLCIVLFALTGCTTSGSTIRFGAADIGGMYYSFANTFTELANEQGYDFTCKVRTTAGSNANIRLLSDGYIEIGLAQADLIADAYKTNEDLRAIAGLYTETCQLVVRADSNIQTLDDLSGHTVSIGAEESGTERNATQILEFAGMPSSLVATKNLDYIEATKELKAGDIDAFFCTAGRSSLITTIINPAVFSGKLWNIRCTDPIGLFLMGQIINGNHSADLTICICSGICQLQHAIFSGITKHTILCRSCRP